METSTARDAPLRERLAEELRALLARRRISGSQLAVMIDRSQSYVSRRLTGDTAFDVDDIERISGALGIQPVDLFRAGRDAVTLRYPTSAGRPGVAVTAAAPQSTDRVTASGDAPARRLIPRPRSGGLDAAFPRPVRITRPVGV